VDPGARQEYVIVLKVKPDKQLTHVIQRCKSACDPRMHEACVQKDGTLHLTLWKSSKKMTAEEAQRVHCGFEPALPRTVRLSKVRTGAGWDHGTLAINVDLKSGEELRASVRAIKRLPGGKQLNTVDGEWTKLHLSLYRKHGYALSAAADLRKIREVLHSMSSLGSCLSVEVAIKVKGSSYDDSDLGYRVLARELAKAAPQEEDGEQQQQQQEEEEEEDASAPPVVVIGITGATRSGKGRVSEALSKALGNATVVGQDKFWLCSRQRPDVVTGEMSSEEPECINHVRFARETQQATAAAAAESGRRFVIAEGFQLLHDDSVQALLGPIHLLELSRAECIRRRSASRDKLRNPRPIDASKMERVVWPAYERYCAASVVPLGARVARHAAPSTDAEVAAIVRQIVASLRPVVLVAHASVNPIHLGHVDMMCRAKSELESRGYVVVRGIIAVTGEGWLKKKGVHPVISTVERVRLVDLACADGGHGWLCGQDGSTHRSCKRFMDAELPTLRNEMHEPDLRGIECQGSDVFLKYSKSSSKDDSLCVVACRAGEEGSLEEELASDAPAGRRRPTVVLPPASLELGAASSTRARAARVRGDTARLAVICGAAVAAALLPHTKGAPTETPSTY
jgi:hypothetical protein